jgi:hypothetical protein
MSSRLDIRPSDKHRILRRVVAAVIGVVLALLVGALATGAGLDRDRAFYPTITMVVGALYVLFAVLGMSTRAVVLESLVGTVFITLAIVGFQRSLWVVVLALAGHGTFDFVHAAVISNPGVPSWWPAFCGAYDVAAAAYLAWLLKSGRVLTAEHREGA